MWVQKCFNKLVSERKYRVTTGIYILMLPNGDENVYKTSQSHCLNHNVLLYCVSLIHLLKIYMTLFATKSSMTYN